MIEEEITDFKRLKSWIRQLRKSEVNGPTWETAEESKEWHRFLARFDHRDQRKRSPKTFKLHATWHKAEAPKHKAPVRVSRISDDGEAIILSISSLPLGTTTLPDRIKGTYFIGRVCLERTIVRVSAYLRSE